VLVGAAHEALARLLVGDGLALLEALEQLVDDDLGRDLRLAERDVEVIGLAESHLADHVREERRARDLLSGQALLAQGLMKLLAAATL
jgi:hypothetical protein